MIPLFFWSRCYPGRVQGQVTTKVAGTVSALSSHPEVPLEAPSPSLGLITEVTLTVSMGTQVSWLKLPELMSFIISILCSPCPPEAPTVASLLCWYNPFQGYRCQFVQVTWRCDFEIHSFLVAVMYQGKSTLFSSGLLFFDSFFQVLMASQLT